MLKPPNIDEAQQICFHKENTSISDQDPWMMAYSPMTGWIFGDQLVGYRLPPLTNGGLQDQLVG